ATAGTRVASAGGDISRKRNAKEHGEGSHDDRPTASARGGRDGGHGGAGRSRGRGSSEARLLRGGHEPGPARGDPDLQEGEAARLPDRVDRELRGRRAAR